MSTPLVGVVAMALAMATGCSADTTNAGETASPPPRAMSSPASPETIGSAPPSPPSGEACDPMAARTEEAIPVAGADLFAAEHELPAQLDWRPEGDRYSWDRMIVAVGATGEVLEERGRRIEPVENPRQEGGVSYTGVLVASDPATGDTQQIRGEGDIRKGYTSHPELSDDYAVWFEYPAAMGQGPDAIHWSLYATDRATGETFLVAEAFDMDRDFNQSAGTTPSLNGDWVYWVDPRPNPEDSTSPVVNVYGRNLDTKEPAELVVENAISPVATEDWLYYLHFGPDGFDSPEYAVYRLSLTTGETELIHESSGDPDDETSGQVSALAAYGDTVAWSLGRRQKALVFTGATQVAEVTTDERSLSGLDAGRDMISLRSVNSGGTAIHSYLLDLRSGCLYDLGDRNVRLSGDAVLWFTDSGDEDRPLLPHVGTRS